MSNTKLKAFIIVLLFVVVSGAIWLTAYSKFFYSLYLHGDSNVKLNLCEYYEDEGVEATRYGKDISDQVKVHSTLDTQKPGEYTITYSLDNLEVSRNITVSGEMDPVVELTPSTETDVLLGESFAETGYKAYDDDGTDLTHEVEVSGYEFTRAGEGEIVYKVTDKEGNCTAVTRKINVLPNTDIDVPGLPICMYHYVYDENDPPEDLQKKYKNYIKQSELKEELEWLKAEGYYFPTWEEVREYVDGKLILPEKSIVLCFDDGQKDFLKYGIPVIDECEVPVTCFLITSSSGRDKVRKYQSEYVTYQSHSHDMHRPGGNIGHGGVFTALTEEEALQDLLVSVEICGNGEAFAYPFGDYTETCRNTVEKAGFYCAVTTVYGKAYPGMDPMLLPRVRMNNDQTLQQFESMVAPSGEYLDEI